MDNPLDAGPSNGETGNPHSWEAHAILESPSLVHMGILSIPLVEGVGPPMSNQRSNIAGTDRCRRSAVRHDPIVVAHAIPHQTCLHSLSSATFERDIEQLASPHPTSLRDPHHISRAITHELDAAVPSVLTSAISALNVGSGDDISVIAPTQVPMARFGHSRSPSPTGRPLFGDRQSTGPYPPGGFPTHSHSNAPSPPATDVSPALSPNVTGTSPPNNGATSPSSPLSPTTPPLPTARPRPRKSNPQLNTDTAQNRLSFMSYHDLLASTPLASVPLSSIVSGAGEPGHLPGVIGMHGHGSIGGLGAAEGEGGDVGGEFDREGLGKGLEERLEGVLNEGRA